MVFVFDTNVWVSAALGSSSCRKAFDLANYLLITERVDVKAERLLICRDPKDNMLLELAISRQTDFIISGDKDLLSLNSFQGVSIISPANYLRMVV